MGAALTPRQDLITYRNHCRRMAKRMRDTPLPVDEKAREIHEKTLAQWEAIDEETTAWLDRPSMVDLDDRAPSDADVPLMGG